MTYCLDCKAPVKYIVSKDNIIKVNVEEKFLVTDRGRIVKGYEIHSCKKDSTGNEEANKE
ncbi:hypothetical protein [Treponema putidum]|uniref:hypothetical protein n=1 Tax=Treponema putidum TaxID=221027 RepID=UPI003D944F03